MINYYVFDRIKKDDHGCYLGYKGVNCCEVYALEPGDTDSDLAEKGFAKCDAPGTETFVVEELAYACL